MKTNQDDLADITIHAADEVVAVIEGHAEINYIGNTKVISVRLPVHLSARIQSLAHKSGKTRNAMIVNLLEVGVEEVFRRLKPETVDLLQELESEAIADHFGQHDQPEA